MKPFRLNRGIAFLFVLSMPPCTAALAAAPAVSASVIGIPAANQTTLTFLSSATGTGYVTLLNGSNPTPGSADQTRTGLDGANASAYRIATLSLAGNVPAQCTFGNLQADTAYTACFTADDGATIQTTVVTAFFRTASPVPLGGRSWVAFHNAGLPTGTVPTPSLAFAHDGTPYLAYSDAAVSGKATVQRFGGTAWTLVGSADFTAGWAYGTVLLFSPDGTPYLSYQDGYFGPPHVSRFDGTNWVAVGGALTTGQAFGFNLAFSPDGTPYVGFQDGSDGPAKVMRFTQGAWAPVDTSGLAAIGSLAFGPDGSLYTIFDDVNNGYKATVMKSSGAAWTTVGSADFSNGQAYTPVLAFAPDNTLYAFFTDNFFPSVMKFSAGAWTPVGDLSGIKYDSLAGSAFGPDGTPWICYRDYNNNTRLTVLQFTGGAWQVVGNSDFSGGSTSSSALIFAPDGTPYVPYEDSANNNQATIMKLTAPPAITGVIAPAPATYGVGDSLTLSVTFDDNVTVTGIPRLALNFTGQTGYAIYQSGSGTNTVAFRYVIRAGDLALSGLSIDPAIDLNRGTIKSLAGFTAGVALPGGSISASVIVSTQNPNLVTPAASQIGANQVALTLQADVTGTGYLTLLAGSSAAPGTGPQIRLGLDANGQAALQIGSLPLTAGSPATYIFRNLLAHTSYTVCFTAEDSTTSTSFTFTTAAAPDFTNSVWIDVSPPASAKVSGGFGIKLAFTPDGTAYLATSDASKVLSVWRRQATTWSLAGTGAGSLGQGTLGGFDISPNGVPGLLFADVDNSGQFTFKSLVAGNWVTQGTTNFPVNTLATYPTLAFGPDCLPYSVFLYGGPIPSMFSEASLLCLQNGVWTDVGPRGFTPSTQAVGMASVAMGPNGTPLVAYSANSFGLAMTYDGYSWSTAGTTNGQFASFAQTWPGLSLVYSPAGVPFVGFSNSSLTGGIATLAQGTWSTFAAPPNTGAPRNNFPDLAFAPDGALRVAFAQPPGDNPGSIALARYDGTSWTTETTAPYSGTDTRFVSLVYSPQGYPYLVFPSQNSTPSNSPLTILKRALVPVVTGLSSPASTSLYALGSRLVFTVDFTIPVHVDTAQGVPRIALHLDSSTVYATYQSGSDTTALVFSYTVQAADLALSGVTVSATLDLNGGTLASVEDTVPANLSLGSFVTANTIRVRGGTAQLVNISTRAASGPGANVTIGGFVVNGSVPKKYLIHAVGPTLTANGIGPSEVLLDPTIELHDALHGNAIIATNDNWGDNSNASEIVTTGAQVGATVFAPGDTTSSALLVTLSPGIYTFVAQGKSNTQGVVLLEVYDADIANPGATIVNISSRANAMTGSGVAIGGFAVAGNAPKWLLVRAVGPTLTTQSLSSTEVLQDPVVEVHDALHGNAIIATNDNWGDNPNPANIVATGARVGATPFATGDTTSSALLLVVPPGVYSFVASGKNNTTGIVLLEIYDAD